MRRRPVKQMFRTWMKTLLLHYGYKYLFNLLVALVVTYNKKGQMYRPKLSLIPSQVIMF